MFVVCVVTSVKLCSLCCRQADQKPAAILKPKRRLTRKTSSECPETSDKQHNKQADGSDSGASERSVLSGFGGPYERIDIAHLEDRSSLMCLCFTNAHASHWCNLQRPFGMCNIVCVVRSSMVASHTMGLGLTAP